MEGTYLRHHQASAERVVGVLRDARPKLACRRSDGTRELPNPEAVATLDALSDRELAALEVLSFACLGWQRAASDRAVLLRLRGRLADHAGRLDADDRAMLDEVGRRYGATRPIHPLTPVCVALSGRGFTPTEIAHLLDALGLERIDDPEGARQRVSKRLRRAERSA